MSDPVQRYREVVAELAGAVVDLRERDSRRADELRRRLRATEEDLYAAGDAVTLARGMLELRWESALRIMWMVEEPGRPRPRPDHRAKPEQYAELEAAADIALDELRTAAGRRMFGLPRRT